MKLMIMNFYLKTMCWNRRLPAWIYFVTKRAVPLNGRRSKVAFSHRFLSIFSQQLPANETHLSSEVLRP
ncbi:MAG: hypothetical protein IJ793_00280 [Opitutales bacterium]|nr:hypothetical protein [Opitutales bacterium]